jgi:polyhydroxyalkanoate synthesis regulator phasin
MENIDELFKKFVYTGVGMASMAKDRLEKTIQEIVEKNKMKTEEGEKIMKDFMDSTEKKAKEIKETINKIVEKAKSEFKTSSADEVENLKQRIKTLEDLLEKHNIK